jgi:transcription elongation factor SPT6
MFLHIVNAEEQNLIIVKVTVEPEVRDLVDHRLTEAYLSDGFSQATKAWNEERKKVVQESIDKHLIPAAARWVREYVKEEAGDYMATTLGDQIRRVCSSA